MLRWEVERLFENEKEYLLNGLHSSDFPVAVLLGGQPASGKSNLTERVLENNRNKNFLIVNGDDFRIYHPAHSDLIKNPLSYSDETQIFSNVFTEKLIEEAIKNKFDIIIEGTMRIKDVPASTAKMFKEAGFKVEAYVIAAPALFSEIGIYSRYQREVEKKDSGRLADINSHNEAVKGLLISVDSLFRNNSVDKISIYSFGAKEKIKDYNFNGHSWNCYLSPADVIKQSREQQLNNPDLYTDRLVAAYETLHKIDNNLQYDVQQVINKMRDDVKFSLPQLRYNIKKFFKT